jgi:hypothetical protein
MTCSLTCSLKNPAARRFVFRSLAANAAYIVLILFAAQYFHRFHPHGSFAYLLAVLPSIAILGVIVSLGLYLVEEKDEFQRNLMVELLLWGLGGVLVLTSAWGSLETFVHIRHFNPSWTYQLFWIFFILRTPFLLRKYR